MPGSQKRYFTRLEDELIVAQSRGEVSIKSLMRKMKTGHEAIMRRAAELGVRPFMRRRARYSKREHPNGPMQGDHGDNPYRISRDTLLERLQKFHGESNGEKT